MSKFKFLYLLLAAGLFLVGFMGFTIYRMDEAERKDKTTKVMLADRDSTLNFYDLYSRTLNESASIKNVIVFPGNDSAKQFHLFDRTKKGKCLVFRFSGLFCDKCIDDDVKAISTAFPDFATNDRLILLCSDVSPRMKPNFDGKELTSFLNEDAGLDYEKNMAPFFFIIDSSKICKMFYVPSAQKPQLTSAYLRIIKHRFFN